MLRPRAILVSAVALMLTGVAVGLAQSSSGTSYTFERGFPSRAAGDHARDDADFQRAVIAYRFWYPTVSAEGIFAGARGLGIEDGKGISIAAVGPRQVAFTANSDTPYGFGVLDVTNGPMVIELPPGQLIGLVNDHHQGWVLDMGLPGPDAGKGGKHLLVPPDYKGSIPAGYQVGRTRSLKNLIAVRALPAAGDVESAMRGLRSIKIYPLASAAHPEALPAVDTSDKSMDATLLGWEDNIQYWEALHRIISAEPLVASFLPMYGLLGELGIDKGKPFAPDARMRAILERAAKTGRDQMLVSSFDSAPTGSTGRTASGNGSASFPAARNSRPLPASTSKHATAGLPRRSSPHRQCLAARLAQGRCTGSAHATTPAPISTAARPTS